jgi:hypothetical protein
MDFSIIYLIFALSTAAPSPQDSIIIDTFTNCKSGNLPCGWEARKKETGMFSVNNENGNYFLSIKSRDDSNPLAKRFNYQPGNYPFLSWKWRAHTLPAGAKENDKKRGDSGAGVYVVFKGGVFKNILKYVWSTSLPQGTTTKSPYYGKEQIIVLESGTEKLGMWVSEKVNIESDYKRLFGKAPPAVVGIAVISSSDATKTSASADYDDFVISK